MVFTDNIGEILLQVETLLMTRLPPFSHNFYINIPSYGVTKNMTVICRHCLKISVILSATVTFFFLNYVHYNSVISSDTDCSFLAK